MLSIEERKSFHSKGQSLQRSSFELAFTLLKFIYLISLGAYYLMLKQIVVFGYWVIGSNTNDFWRAIYIKALFLVFPEKVKILSFCYFHSNNQYINNETI